jgi:hypothetical protein
LHCARCCTPSIIAESRWRILLPHPVRQIPLLKTLFAKAGYHGQFQLALAEILPCIQTQR